MIFFLISISLTIFTANASTINNDYPDSNKLEKTSFDNTIFNEIISKLNAGKCLSVQVSSTSIRKKGSKEYAFTSYGIGSLSKVNNSTIKANRVQTSFSDRSFFKGSKTVENYTITCTSTVFNIKVNYQTWGNQTINLRDAIIFKGRHGYFVTGNYYDGKKIVFYTIAIYEVNCLI